MRIKFTGQIPLWRSIIVTLAILLGIMPASARRDDDVVILKNGDRITGEIKRLQRGELSLYASYMTEAVHLDWSKVERLESKSKFLIFLTNGSVFTGSIQVVSEAGLVDQNFLIGVDNERLKVKQSDVIKITPAEERFWHHLEGSVDFGFNFTSGNSQYQAELLASTTYRRGDHSLTASVDTVFSGQTKGSSTARKQFTFDYSKQLTPKYYVGGLVDLLSSDQQSLELRTSAGGLIGRNLRRTERTRWSVFGGVVGAREKYSSTTSQSQTTDVAAITGVDFLTFRFTKTDIRSRLVMYPSLTTPGRVRMQATSYLRIKIARDFFWGFHIYENFDNKPPIPANKNDLGISTSLGWKF